MCDTPPCTGPFGNGRREANLKLISKFSFIFFTAFFTAICACVAVHGAPEENQKPASTTTTWNVSYNPIWRSKPRRLPTTPTLLLGWSLTAAKAQRLAHFLGSSDVCLRYWDGLWPTSSTRDFVVTSLAPWLWLTVYGRGSSTA